MKFNLKINTLEFIRIYYNILLKFLIIRKLIHILFYFILFYFLFYFIVIYVRFLKYKNKMYFLKRMKYNQEKSIIRLFSFSN